MSETIQNEAARLLTTSEQEAVNLTLHPAIGGLSRPELQTLARRLREARDRARAIASQQRREMRGKSAPRGATAARDDAGTVAKEQVLADAVRRISEELRRGAASADPPATAEDPPANAERPPIAKPSGGPPVESRSSKATTKLRSSPGMAAKPSKLATVRADPREVGRVSKSVMSAQARRDAKPR